MVVLSSPLRKIAWSGIGGKGENIYWSTCRGKGFLIECLTSGGMIRQLVMVLLLQGSAVPL